MKLIYVPNDYHLIVNNITRVLNHDYSNRNVVKLDEPKYFDLIGIIIKIPKDEMSITTLFNHNLSKFTIVETQYNYYIGLSIYTACKIAYKNKLRDDFSEKLYDLIKYKIPNIFDQEKILKYFKDRAKVSVNNIFYNYRLIDILDDIYSMNNAHMDILVRNSDLSKEELNKLFRITVKYLISIEDLLKLRELDNLIVFNNSYNYYQNKFHDGYPVSKNIIPHKDLIGYLKCISEEDKYTNHNIEIGFKTSISAINKFSHNLIKSYKKNNPDVLKILPISTLVDAYVSIPLNHISLYANINDHISYSKSMLLFRNDYMNFALSEEEYNND